MMLLLSVLLTSRWATACRIHRPGIHLVDHCMIGVHSVFSSPVCVQHVAPCVSALAAAAWVATCRAHLLLGWLCSPCNTTALASKCQQQLLIDCTRAAGVCGVGVWDIDKAAVAVCWEAAHDCAADLCGDQGPAPVGQGVGCKGLWGGLHDVVVVETQVQLQTWAGTAALQF